MKKRNFEIFVKTLFHEGGSTRPLIEVEAIAWIIRNRVEHRSWDGRTYAEVCLMPKQFSCWNKRKPENVKITNSSQWLICKIIALYVISAPEKWNPLPGIFEYANLKLCNPKWKSKMKIVEYKTNFKHTFFKLKK